jgi:hypothetical protein
VSGFPPRGDSGRVVLSNAPLCLKLFPLSWLLWIAVIGLLIFNLGFHVKKSLTHPFK